MMLTHPHSRRTQMAEQAIRVAVLTLVMGLVANFAADGSLDSALAATEEGATKITATAKNVGFGLMVVIGLIISGWGFATGGDGKKIITGVGVIAFAGIARAII